MTVKAARIAVRERPIIFTGPMVRAILFSGMDLGFYCTGVPSSGYVLRSRGAGGCWNDRTRPAHCPYGAPGDRLWVRETFWFRASDGLTVYDDGAMCLHPSSIMGNGRGHMVPPPLGGLQGTDMARQGFKRKPGIHMPRWASRLTLEVTEVRVERLRAITEADVETEGVLGTSFAFGIEWDKIHEKSPALTWDANPWVWVVSFRKVAEARAVSSENSTPPV